MVLKKFSFPRRLPQKRSLFWQIQFAALFFLRMQSSELTSPLLETLLLLLLPMTPSEMTHRLIWRLPKKEQPFLNLRSSTQSYSFLQTSLTQKKFFLSQAWKIYYTVTCGYFSLLLKVVDKSVKKDLRWRMSEKKFSLCFLRNRGRPPTFPPQEKKKFCEQLLNKTKKNLKWWRNLSGREETSWVLTPAKKALVQTISLFTDFSKKAIQKMLL